jgi:hypothetical protein
MLIQTLIPLDGTPNQERPAAPESSEARFILCAGVAKSWAKSTTQLEMLGDWSGQRATLRAYRETEGSDQVPETNVPPQDVPGRGIPVFLGLEHEKGPISIGVSC